ncbi:MAG: hypothetical protein FJX77_07620 [Armatimonadetes bacterium]|nr:hypothetical protein [Armatimonadota bacterium]
MEISDWAVAALAGVVGVNTLFIAGLTVALFLIHRRLQEAVQQAAPLLERSATTLARVEESTARLEARLDPVLEKSAGLVERVTERVDRLTTRVEEAVAEPLVGTASLVAGIHRGIQVYAEQVVAGEENSNGGQS